MNYTLFQSIVESRKQPIRLDNPSDSFFVVPKRPHPYVEPNFKKIAFPSEKPSIILVSAVGASGKTTTARVLSHDIDLPILDLAQHKPVADHTLTGIITSVYAISKIANIFQGLSEGSHGIIVDGMDEGRSKTTEKAFEAFLDDLIARCKRSDGASLVLFGRSQVLFDTWCYLDDRGADVGLIQIEPFNLNQARRYIADKVPNVKANQYRNFLRARDKILDNLGSVFKLNEQGFRDKKFLEFIGYPPVLDAIAKLLFQDQNYHRVSERLDRNRGTEVSLLIEICDYLAIRERDEKTKPNFLDVLCERNLHPRDRDAILSLYDKEEQCARVLARALDCEFEMQFIPDDNLNTEYEDYLSSWSDEHPFLDDGELRNAVFQAYSVVRCALSERSEYRELAHKYGKKNRPTYHILYILHELTRNRKISSRIFNLAIQASSEFVGIDADIRISVDGNSWDEQIDYLGTSAYLEITVHFPKDAQERSFEFSGIVDTEEIRLGPYLVNTQVMLPCSIELFGESKIEAIGDCRLSASSVTLSATDLVLRSSFLSNGSTESHESGLFIDTKVIDGHVEEISHWGREIDIRCMEQRVQYPLAQYTTKIPQRSVDSEFMPKYRRIRRILSSFASHKKGGLAKFAPKIEHPMVLQNELGERILRSLVKEGVLYLDGQFYFIDQSRCNQLLGITWPELRKYQSSDKLSAFLARVS